MRINKLLHTLFVIIPGVLLVTFFMYPCPPEKARPEKNWQLNYPESWPEPVYKFDKNNKLTKAGFELGRTLFYDRRLSRNNTISCGSCHQQFAAFAHLDHPTSHGIESKLGTRNTPPLFNLNWQPAFFWDGSVNHIEVQPISPMQNPVEMDEKLENAVNKVAGDTMYKRLFKTAYGDEKINSQRLLKALAQFMGMMVSCNSKYDKVMRKEIGVEFTASETNGLSIFRSICSSCHKEPLFTDFSYRNTGLMPKFKTDSGRATITKQSGDLYKFKVPSLRNLKYTWPYMHDGRFNELEQVLEHYAGDKFKTATLDPAMHLRLYLTATEKADLLAFLNTLNDEEFVKDVRFKDNSGNPVLSDHSHSFEKR
ncbi:cytochrome-c peroxidase [Polluticoccus soli]|uniref:cytochrome-c peroxidase n=1 Tax=Polluticoccus soli TaxID=3034150 RepID=UPI0023E0FB78|nr:cytochrome c peroxidase [Flavipsychrobacter sp. JY13-12]